MISGLQGSGKIPFPYNDREGHKFTRAVKGRCLKRLLAAEASFLVVRPRELNRQLKKAFTREKRTSGAKAPTYFQRLVARVNSCPSRFLLTWFLFQLPVKPASIWIPDGTAEAVPFPIMAFARSFATAKAGPLQTFFLQIFSFQALPTLSHA